jgi:hypothetical protein
MTVQPIHLSIDVVQVAIYAALALGGYVLRHLNVFGHRTAPGGSAQSTLPSSHPILDKLASLIPGLGSIQLPSPAAPAPRATPILDQVLPLLESELMQVLQEAARRLLQPSAQPPAPTGPARA